MADLYLTPAERYTAALGGFYYGDLPEPGTVYTQLIKDILDGSTPDKVPKNILARFVYSLYISDLGDPYPRYELAKLLYWKLHDITPTKSGSVLTVTIDGKEDYMTINTDLSRLWYKVLFGSKTDIITEFPYIFNTMQNKLSDWELFGNTEVSGTSTPDNPIQPQETGERTGNLFVRTGETENAYIRSDGEVRNSNDWNISDYIAINSASTYSFEPNTSGGNAAKHAFYDANKDFISTIESGEQLGIVPPVNATYMRFSYRDSSTNIMLNSGSTALPYEPYGFKIPISSANTTTPVYLGEVETVRQIKKLVLDGSEDWVAYSSIADCYRLSLQPNTGITGNGLCSHFEKVGNTSQLTNGTFVSGQNYSYFKDTTVENLSGWKSYLQQQYAAGTPVCVWYVLANETTGIVNEPLRKIGDYADSISRAQTGIDIPTVIGQNTLDVLTTVKPSSMSIEYVSADETKSRSKRISLLKSTLKK